MGNRSRAALAAALVCVGFLPSPSAFADEEVSCLTSECQASQPLQQPYMGIIHGSSKSLRELISVVLSFDSQADCVKILKAVPKGAIAPPRDKTPGPSGSPESFCAGITSYPFSVTNFGVEYSFPSESDCEEDLGPGLEGSGISLFKPQQQSAAQVCQPFPWGEENPRCTGDCCECTNNAGVCESVPAGFWCNRGPLRDFVCQNACW